MRKNVSVFLLFVFVISCLSACVDSPDTPVKPEDDEPSPEQFVTEELIMPDAVWGESGDIAAEADVLRGYLTDYYALLAKYPVRHTGDASYKEGEYAVWVQELPEYQPCPNETDPDYQNVKAIYIYYPMDKDPSGLSDEQLKAEGVVRVFAYIGYPHEKAPGKYPGMVCIHGGDRSANPDYVIEAVKHGFTAIAPDTCGQHIPVSGVDASSKAIFDNTYFDYVAHDEIGHKDCVKFTDIDNPLDEQWFFWAIGDTVLANSVLRAEEHTDSDKIGITGLSWGGVITTTAACFDYRYAFAAPVYHGFYVAESLLSDLGLGSNKKANTLWQDVSLLKQSPVPILMLAGDSDACCTVNCNVKTYHDLQNGYLVIRPWFEHGDMEAISADEPYRYGLYVMGLGFGFVEAERQPTKEDGREYSLKVNIPDDMYNVSATLFWAEGPIDASAKWNFKNHDLVFDKETNTVTVSVPENAYMYYISFRGYDPEIQRIKSEGTPYSYGVVPYTGQGSPSYCGTVFSSTDIVVLGDGWIVN